MSVDSGKDRYLKEEAGHKSAEPTVEEIFEKLGGYSWFQILATVIIICPEIPAAMLAISPVLIGRSVKSFTCGSDGRCTLRNDTGTNPTVPTSNGFFEHTSINEEFELFGERAWLVDWLTSVQMIGCTIGALFCSLWADNYGRKKVFYSLVFLMGLSGALSGCAINVASYAVARFCTGVAVGGMYVHYLIYLMEFLTPSFRTICGCISFWALGEMFLGLIGYLIPQWRLLTWTISLPAVVLMISFPWLPESPRFLLCKGRTQEAIEVFSQIAKLNKKPEVDVAEILQLQTVMWDRMKESKFKLSEKTSIVKLKVVSSVLTSPRQCKNLLIFGFAWFTCSIAYYGLSFNTKNLGGNVYLNVFYLGVSDLPGHLSGILFNNRFGRKKSMNIFLLLGTWFFVSLAAIEELQVSQWSPSLLVVLSLFGRYCISATWAIVACFTSESFPTAVRAFCMGLCAFSANIGGIIAPYMGLLGSVWASGPYILMSMLSAMMMLFVLGLEEAVEKPLQDTIAIT